jgi:uncharacterized protein (UPF0548 family)
MTLWRFGRGWPESTLRQYLAEQRTRKVNFNLPPEQMTAENGWTVDGDDAPIGTEPPGPPQPGGLFERAKQALVNYEFSDPSIVVGHFDPNAPLEGRDMLLEIKVWGFRFLNGVRVQRVRDESDEHRTSFGFRYDTLEGHIEQGFEWFLLSKNHESGQIRFRIEAHWRLGEFPNWWTRIGFLLLGARYRKIWRRRAVARLRALAQHPTSARPTQPAPLAPGADAIPDPTNRVT